MNLKQIILSPVFPLWMAIALFALTFALSLLQFRATRRRLSLAKSLSLFSLRGATLVLLILFALNPTRVERREIALSPTLAVLVDTSPAMGLPGPEGKGSRLEQARALLLGGPAPVLKGLAEKFDIRLYQLGDPLRALKPEDLPGLEPKETRGDLRAALSQLAGTANAVLLVSDGTLLADESSLPGLPVFSLPLGQPDKYRDILIKTVKAPSLAFQGREAEMDVTIKGHGYPGLRIPVALRDGQKLLRAKDVRLDEKTGEGTVSLSFVPEKPGLHTLSVSVPAQLGESLTSNNTTALSLRVVRDKTRILMITGTPSLGYRYLRMALKSDPSIDLLSFVILRLPSNILNVPLQDQSLIPLPVETLFTKELKDFDLIVFDNFTPGLFFKPQFLDPLREFIKRGGAFAVLGGPGFSGEGGYTGTALEEILPVRWAGKESYRRSTSYGVRVSRAGKTHPVTRSPAEGNGRGVWQELPPLEGINTVRPKSSGTVLLETSEETSWPVLTVGSYGKGRVLVLATDDLWKWYMGMAAQGKGTRAYFQLIERMVRWLTQDPSLETVQVHYPEVPARIGEEMELRVQVLEEQIQGKASAISASVQNSERVGVPSQLRPSGREGEYLLSFRPEKPGWYKWKIETRAGAREEAMLISGSGTDLDGFPNHELLKRISASSGGKTLSGKDELLKELKSYAEKVRNRFVEESRDPIWSNPYVLALVLTFMSLEWYLRRRWGLI